MVDKVDSLEQMLKDKEYQAYNQRINTALENLYAILADGNSGWVNGNYRLNVSNAVDEIKATHWPRVYARRIRDFINTYEKLVTEFPDLVQLAAQAEENR